MKTKEFRSPAGDIRVALTNGHVTIITEEPVQVGEIFWNDAYSLGAISGDMSGDKLATEVRIREVELANKNKKETDELTAILVSLFENPQGALNKNGEPLVRKVAAMLGRPVVKGDMLKLWEQLKETEGK